MIVHARRADTTLAKPFLDLGNIGPLIKYIGRAHGPRRVRAEPNHRHAELFAVDFDQLVVAVGCEGGVRRPAPVVADRLEEGA